MSLKSLFEDKHLVIFSYPKVRRRTSSHIADDAMFCLARSDSALTLRVSRTCVQADTPGCTTQACGYRDVRSEYEEHGATVIGLSTDKPTAQLKWKSKHELGYSLLSDPKHTLLSKLGWSEKNKCVLRRCYRAGQCPCQSKRETDLIPSLCSPRLSPFRAPLSIIGAATGSSRRAASSPRPSSASSPPTTPGTRALP